MSTMVIGGKKGDRPAIVKDEEGYFKIRLGSFNTYNNSGSFWLVKDVNKLFGPGTLINDRLRDGILFCEYDHPKGLLDMPLDKQRSRTLTIDPDRVCGHIKKVEIIRTNKTEPGFRYPIIHIDGWVKPTGPYADYLKDYLETPSINATFSIRALSKYYKLNGIVIKEPVVISTWDYVSKPGIKKASQWTAAGIEADVSIPAPNDEELDELIASVESEMTCKDGVCIVRALKKLKDTEDIILGL